MHIFAQCIHEIAIVRITFRSNLTHSTDIIDTIIIHMKPLEHTSKRSMDVCFWLVVLYIYIYTFLNLIYLFFYLKILPATF